MCCFTSRLFSCRYLLQVFLTCSVILSIGPLTYAQVPNNSSDSTPNPIPGEGHDFIGMLSETVAPEYGNLSIRIKTPTPSGRRMTLPFSFAYDSGGIFATDSLGWDGPISGYLNQGGWSYTLPMLQVQSAGQQRKISNTQTVTCKFFTNYVFNDTDGTRLNLMKGQVPDGPAPNCPQTTHISIVAGNHFAIQYEPLPVLLAPRDGTIYQLGSSRNDTENPNRNQGIDYIPNLIEDSNGNELQITDSTPASSATIRGFTVTDDIGRMLVSSTGLGTSGDTVHVSGLSSAYTLTWANQGVNFSTTWTNVNPPPPPESCPATTTKSVSSTFSAVSAITLPNGQTYKFSYDQTYGMVNKITYPSGGYVSYVWGFGPSGSQVIPVMQSGGSSLNCHYTFSKPAILQRSVSFDGKTTALQQDFAYTGAGASTTLTTHDLVSGVTSVTTYTYDGQGLGEELSVVYQDGNGNTLKTVNKTWYNPVDLESESVTLDNGATSKTTYTYLLDELAEKDEYDFGQTTPTRKTVYTYQSFSASPLMPATTESGTVSAVGASPMLNKPCSVVVSDGSGNPIAETDYFYDNAPTTTVCGASGTPSVTSVSGLIANTHDETNYSATSTAPRGNLTTEIKRCFPGCSDEVTTHTYDETGQITSTTDPKGNVTQFSYADSYTDSTPSGHTNARLTKITHPSTNGVSHVESFSYAYSDSQLTVSTDENSLQTKYTYNDSLRRLTETDRPDGGKTTIAYNDSPPSPTVTTSKTINSSKTLTTVAVMDGMAHVVQKQVTSDPQGTVLSEISYDGSGHVATGTNAHRGTSDPTSSPGTTKYAYDSLGRKISETYPDSSVLTTAYCGPNTLVTDPTGKMRRSRVDGLGRLVEVDEPNAPGVTLASTGCPGTNELIWITSYTLDTLSNLTNVVQNGSHQRTFNYDSLSHLVCASNPENSTAACPAKTSATYTAGTVGYTYDLNGNLTTKTDARGIIATYSHDALNRLTGVTYSNKDPSVTITYDQSACLGLSACQNIGERTSMTDPAGSEAWAYQTDATNLRNLHVNQRTTGGVTKTTKYFMDLAGNTTQIVYPTGRTVNYTYDAANRPATATDASNGITYATAPNTALSGCLTGAVCYTPQGSVYSMSIGKTSSFAGLNISETFNSRLQPLEIKTSSTAGNALDLTYNFIDPVTSKDSGNVYGIANKLNSSRSQAFTYDQLNRIISAGTTATTGTFCWGYHYTYDAWANLQSQAGWTPRYNACTESTMGAVTAYGNNHLPGFSYDAAGNTLKDGVNTYTWDAESQLKTAAGVTYSYDGDGRRAAKVASKLYWYGSGGEILSETDATGKTLNDYIFFDGKRIALVPASGTALFYAEDMLGSSRVIVEANGTLCYDADFTPFGGERAYTNICSQNNYKFEGKERDTETGNDDFGARYYSNRFGRWLSSDWSGVPAPVPYANLTNPQTLNLYTMVADDPESFADLDGHQQGGQSHQPDGCQGTLRGLESCEVYGISPQQAHALKDQQTENDEKKAEDARPDPAQNNAAQELSVSEDPTAPPPPPTPDPAGVRTDPSLNPATDSNSSASSPADLTQAPLESRGQGGRKGERRGTGKPDATPNPGKHARPSKDKPERWEVKDPHTGKWVLKPPGWAPLKRDMIEGGAAVGVGAAIGYGIHVIVTTAPEWLPYVAGAAAF